MKKRSIFLTFVLASFLVGGCSPKTLPKTETQEDSGTQLSQKSSDDIEFNVVSLPSSDERNELIETLVKDYLTYTKDDGEVRYFYHPIYLNEDNENLKFVYLVGPSVSGTGGGTGLIVDTEEKTILNEFTLVNTPVIVSEDKTNGFNDIIMQVSGGGAESKYVRLKYDGENYPSNPSMVDDVVTGRVEGFALISDDIKPDTGLLLE